MKLNVLSDLHLSVGALERPRTDADLIVLAGDVARPQAAAEWALGLDRPVLYVIGNHEFYGSSIEATRAELARLFAGTHVHLLDDGERVIDGVRFLGSTLWTDFRLAGGDAAAQQAAVEQALKFNRDYSRIRIGGAPFTPAASAALFARHAAWLEQRLAAPHPGPTVVITHHAPARGSIHPRFAGSPLNNCFVSDAQWLIDGSRVGLWIHGHTHDSFDYRVNGTRVLCNPRGYFKDGANENPQFDPLLVVEV